MSDVLLETVVGTKKYTLKEYEALNSAVLQKSAKVGLTCAEIEYAMFAVSNRNKV
jgi:hypothetical protein